MTKTKGVRQELRDARLRAGLTQARAAELAGYSGKSSWAMVETGRATPGIDQMRTMARVLGVMASDVFLELQEGGSDHDPAASA